MFSAINKAFNREKRAIRDHALIMESVFDVEEVIPGSDAEMDDIIDTESVPDDVYRKVDAMLDKVVADPNYDDTEVEEIVDDDVDESEISDEDLNAIVDEAFCNPAMISAATPRDMGADRYEFDYRITSREKANDVGREVTVANETTLTISDLRNMI